MYKTHFPTSGSGLETSFFGTSDLHGQKPTGYLPMRLQRRSKSQENRQTPEAEGPSLADPQSRHGLVQRRSRELLRSIGAHQPTPLATRHAHASRLFRAELAKRAEPVLQVIGLYDFPVADRLDVDSHDAKALSAVRDAEQFAGRRTRNLATHDHPVA